MQFPPIISSFLKYTIAAIIIFHPISLVCSVCGYFLFNIFLFLYGVGIEFYLKFKSSASGAADNEKVASIASTASSKFHLGSKLYSNDQFLDLSVKENAKWIVKPIVVPLALSYLLGRLGCFALMNLIEFSFLQIIKTVPIVIKVLNLLFKWFIKQLKHIRLVFHLIYSYIIYPLYAIFG